MSLETIHSLNKTHHCEKAWHNFKGVGFLNIYEQYMESSRLEVKRVLEIGAREGRSLRLWRDYFPNAQIFAIDIAEYKQAELDWIKVFRGSQEDTAVLGEIVKQAGGKFDMIVDDGSHINSLTIKSYNFLFHL